MKKSLSSIKTVQICLVAALIALVYSSNIMAQNTEAKKDHNMQNNGMSMHKHMNMNMGSEKDGKAVSTDNEIVHKGVIDLKAIDKNKDGKVFQDEMDWNVISDAPGKCPLCKMTLQEVTLKQAKENLKKNGFKVKE